MTATNDHQHPTRSPEPAAARAQARRNLAPLALDVAVPLGGYYLLRAGGWDEVGAYGAATAIGAALLVLKALRHRRLDGLSAFILAAFALQFVAAVLVHDIRAGIAADSLLSGLAGVVLLASCLLGRPAFQHLALRVAGSTPEQRATSARRWARSPGFSRTMRTLTLVCGAALLAEAGLRIGLVLTLEPDGLVGFSHVLRVATVAGLGLWIWWYAKRRLAHRTPAAARTAASERV